jgi:hypothetical protein
LQDKTSLRKTSKDKSRRTELLAARTAAMLASELAWSCLRRIGSTVRGCCEQVNAINSAPRALEGVWIISVIIGQYQRAM